MVPGRGRYNSCTVIGKFNRVQANNWLASVMIVLWLLAVVSVKHCPAFEEEQKYMVMHCQLHGGDV